MIGAGRAGLLHAQNASRWVPGAELACLVDADASVAQRAGAELGVAAFASIEDALEGASFDGVVITTPTFTHAQIAVLAAGAGKHVFCEKPMALSVQECDEMAAAAEDAGVVFQLGFVRRFQSEFVEARRRIEAGGIGRPMVVKSLTRGPGLPPPWAHDLRRSNGMLAEVNSHDFDCVRWLVGSEIERVYAETANFKGEAHGVSTPDFYDNAVVTLRFESGALGTIDGTCPADYGYDARVEILGSEGLLVIGENRSAPLLEIRTRAVGKIPTYSTWPQRFEWAYREELQSFVDAALSGGTPAVGAADGRAAVAAVVAANRSWLESRPVSVASEVPV
ncbi:Gfo/Idh/MocA family oxidoreductase [Kribbella sp. NPDC050820]|uniref:Gfo/Idh/MocA family oxidoreductase n=1 Tax=Kribbella sp. NPDC050820 TaxID=3155408 RepID=UPI00340F8DC1